jgi:hypothetical protein
MATMATTGDVQDDKLVLFFVVVGRKRLRTSIAVGQRDGALGLRDRQPVGRLEHRHPDPHLLRIHAAATAAHSAASVHTGPMPADPPRPPVATPARSTMISTVHGLHHLCGVVIQVLAQRPGSREIGRVIALGRSRCADAPPAAATANIVTVNVSSKPNKTLCIGYLPRADATSVVPSAWT